MDLGLTRASTVKYSMWPVTIPDRLLKTRIIHPDTISRSSLRYHGTSHPRSVSKDVHENRLPNDESSSECSA